MLVVPALASAVILPLEFAGGNGNTSVDQFEGIAGSGWATAWEAHFHSGTSNGVATVEDTSPLVPGDGNYLHLTYDTGASGTALARLARQWDTTALSLTSKIIISFDIRSDVDISNSTQTFVLFGSSVSASGTSSSDSWKLTADGGGWRAYNGTTGVTFDSGSINAGDTWSITLIVDPVLDTYEASVQNITQSGTVFTLSDLALRNGDDASLSFLNIHGNASYNLTGRGYSIDDVSITNIPEASSSLLIFGVGALLPAVSLLRRRRA